MRSTSAVFSAIGAGPVLMRATTTIARISRNNRLRTTRRLTSTTRQTPRKNRRAGPGEDADMERTGLRKDDKLTRPGRSARGPPHRPRRVLQYCPPMQAILAVTIPFFGLVLLGWVASRLH